MKLELETKLGLKMKLRSKMRVKMRVKMKVKLGLMIMKLGLKFLFNITKEERDLLDYGYEIMEILNHLCGNILILKQLNILDVLFVVNVRECFQQLRQLQH